jgi:hypothetical protein
LREKKSKKTVDEYWMGEEERERERERGGEIFPSKNSLTRVYPSCICVLRQREWGAPPGS